MLAQDPADVAPCAECKKLREKVETSEKVFDLINKENDYLHREIQRLYARVKKYRDLTGYTS